LGTESGDEYAPTWYHDHHRHLDDDDNDVEEEEDEVLGEYHMDALETLQVSSNLVPLETALYLAERFGERVKCLGLLGSVKSFEFVKELMRVLARKQSSASDPVDEAEPVWQWLTPTPSPTSTSSPNDPSPSCPNLNLRTLKIGPVALSPELIDLLAHNLPNLHHLELIVKHFLPSQDDVPIFGVSGRKSGGASGGSGAGNTVGGGGGSGDGVQLDEQVVSGL
jgi:hypothetical protein